MQQGSWTPEAGLSFLACLFLKPFVGVKSCNYQSSSVTNPQRISIDLEVHETHFSQPLAPIYMSTQISVEHTSDPEH